jgi:hypothetical protein
MQLYLYTLSIFAPSEVADGQACGGHGAGGRVERGQRACEARPDGA